MKPLIDILPPNAKYTLWGRIKTHLWNFILPPHVRLAIPAQPPAGEGFWITCLAMGTVLYFFAMALARVWG